MTDEAMKMAAWIADAAVENHAAAKGTHTWEIARDAAYAAIIETRDRDAARAYRICAETRHVTLGDKVSAAIRSGQQFRKDV